MDKKAEAEKIVKDLKQRGLSDAVYKALWFEYVLGDVESYMTSEKGYDGPPLSEDAKSMAQIVASRYVYNGDYDHAISYWDNIDALIKEERERDLTI